MTDRAIRAAKKAAKQAGSRDPFRVARELDVEILEQDFVRQKGAFCMVEGYPFIFLNTHLGDEEKRAVCAHELGHAVLHRAEAEKQMICEFDLYNMITDVEYEANVFASELLIDEDELTETLSQGMDVYAAAGELGVNVNLLLIKLYEMNRRGGKFSLPYLPYKAFMGD